MRRNIFYTLLIVVGLAFAVWASSTQGDWSVGGNLAVTGTSVQTGAITATGGVVGDLTGNASGFVIPTVAAEGNLPTVGDHTGEMYANAAYETLFVSTGVAWLSYADDL